ncbi:hypothetical protein [Streptomyces tauricus]|uniref:hypothetical protein n=1 Tax=Streptomyces tauricus TaxID=68274 RepID=UPI002244B5E7|nr:hypothetical protein [Streptomyces tauricus]MCW8101754.1 hypothetical protein [Streptomyces tauricus]
MRSLYADFETDLAGIFPYQVHRLTDHEMRELEECGLWLDWNEPVRPGKFWTELDDDGDGMPRRLGGETAAGAAANGVSRSAAIVPNHRSPHPAGT